MDERETQYLVVQEKEKGVNPIQVVFPQNLRVP